MTLLPEALQHVTYYTDPAQEALVSIEAAVQAHFGAARSAGPIMSQLTILSRRRMWALPVDPGVLGELIEDLARGVEAGVGDPQALDNILSLLADLREATQYPEDHPIADQSMEFWKDKDIVIPSQAEPEFRGYWLTHDDEKMRGHLDLAKDLMLNPDSSDIPAWVRQRAVAEAKQPFCLLGWPNSYYEYTWFEHHVWLWFIPCMHVVAPRTCVLQLRPTLWRVSTRDQNANWAVPMNRAFRTALTPSPGVDTIPVEEPLHDPIRSDHNDRVALRISFEDANGTTHTYYAEGLYVWDKVRGELEPALEWARGGPVPETLHLLRLSPLELADALTTMKHPYDTVVEAWRSAAQKALEAASTWPARLYPRTSERLIRKVAAGKVVRPQDPKVRSALYADLRTYGGQDFATVFPTKLHALDLLRKWHGSQAQGGRDAVPLIAAWLAVHGQNATALASHLEAYQATNLRIEEDDA